MASAASKRRTSKARAGKSRRESRRLGYEHLEYRRLMAVIEWANRSDFDTEFGANTAAARAVIDRALLDWGAVISSFNYRNVGQSGWSPVNAFRVNISVENLSTPTAPNTLADSRILNVDGDRKPFMSRIRIDDNAAGTNWYFDPSPGNDEEFGAPVAQYAAGGGPAGYDLYSTVLHELGHGLGISSGTGLPVAIADRITNNIFQLSDGNGISLTSDNSHFLALTHPNDLMTPITPASTRRIISELDARILGEGYGYTINLTPVYDRAFITTFDSATRKLTIQGDLGSPFEPFSKFDRINLDVQANSILVTVNGFRRTIATSSVSSIWIVGREGNDEINIESTRAGILLSINAGVGDNFVFLGPTLRNLNSIQGNLEVYDDGGNTSVNFHDENNSSARTFSINNTSVTFSGSSASVRYSGFSTPDKAARGLILRGGSGGNKFTINNQFASQTFSRILSGSAADTIDVFSVGVQGMNIDGVSGTDRVKIGASSNGMQAIAGSIYVSNSSGLTNLILDDAGDKNRSDVIVRATEILGLTSSVITLDPRGIRSISMLASNAADGRGNTVTVVNTPQNTARNMTVSIKTGKWNDTVRIEGTSSALTVDGQEGADQVFVGAAGRILNVLGTTTIKNSLGRSELIIDNSAETSQRNAFLRADSFNRSSVNIKFVKNDLTLFRYLGGSGGGTFTVEDTPQNSALTARTELVLGAGIDSMVVRRTTSPLTINGNGGADRIVIGNSGKVDAINGTIDISNPPISGRTTLTINGANEVNGHAIEVDAGSVKGLAPADIRFNQGDLVGLVVSAGPAGNSFNVLNTPQNGPRNLQVTLNTGLGEDWVDITGTSSTLTINGQNGDDAVTFDSSNMQGLKNSLTITNLANRTRIFLDNSDDTERRVVTMDVVTNSAGIFGSVRGLAPGQILYRQPDVSVLYIDGGIGGGDYTVRNTISNGVNAVTNLRGGGIDSVQILGTTGPLNVFLPESNGSVRIGASTGTTSGSLDNIRGDITLSSGFSLGGNAVEIIDSSSTGNYNYAMNSERIYRTGLGGESPTGSINLSEFRTSRLSLATARQLNNLQIDGTPMHPDSVLVTPIQIVTGNDRDNVQIRSTTRPLSIDLGDGIFQAVTLADAGRFLDAIQGEVQVKGLGLINVTVSDEASEISRSVKIDNSTAGQTLERRTVDAQGQETLVNKFKFNFAGQGRIEYLAGRVVTGSHNYFEVAGVASNNTVIITAGPDFDIFQVGSGDAGKVLGSVTINSPRPDSDFASFYDSLAPVARRYLLKSDPFDPTGTIVERTGLPPVTFDGLSQLNFATPRVGGNRLDILSSGSSTLNLTVANTDKVSMGSLSPTLGGTMNAVGPISLQSYNVSDAVSVLLDDSGNNTVARNVTIEPYQVTRGILSGFGLPSLTFDDNANFSFDLRGGAADDSFIMRGTPRVARFRIDAGAGNDILVGSGNTLLGGSGRDLLVAGTQASVLNGGASEDILIGGTIIDSTFANLDAIRTIWKGSEAYEFRLSWLIGSLLSPGKVAGNGKQDTLTGMVDALDMFFGELGDSLTDRITTEYAATI